MRGSGRNRSKRLSDVQKSASVKLPSFSKIVSSFENEFTILVILRWLPGTRKSPILALSFFLFCIIFLPIVCVEILSVMYLSQKGSDSPSRRVSLSGSPNTSQCSKFLFPCFPVSLFRFPVSLFPGNKETGKQRF